MGELYDRATDGDWQGLDSTGAEHPLPDYDTIEAADITEPPETGVWVTDANDLYSGEVIGIERVTIAGDTEGNTTPEMQALNAWLEKEMAAFSEEDNEHTRLNLSPSPESIMDQEARIDRRQELAEHLEARKAAIDIALSARHTLEQSPEAIVTFSGAEATTIHQVLTEGFGIMAGWESMGDPELLNDALSKFQARIKQANPNGGL